MLHPWNEHNSVNQLYCNFKNVKDFPGDPVVKTLHLHCMGHRFDPKSGKFHSSHTHTKNGDGSDIQWHVLSLRPLEIHF